MKVIASLVFLVTIVAASAAPGKLEFRLDPLYNMDGSVFNLK